MIKRQPNVVSHYIARGDMRFLDWIQARGVYVDHGYRYNWIYRPFEDEQCTLCSGVIMAGCYAEVSFSARVNELKVLGMVCLTSPECEHYTRFAGAVCFEPLCTEKDACWVLHVTKEIQ
jgi:hypothetical protein